MSGRKKIGSALISVYDKTGLSEILSVLSAGGVKLLSTGGTKAYIEGCGYECAAVEDVTGYPSILGGRVKTLHPKVFGGILGRRDEPEDVSTMVDLLIEPIDLVIVDLYPFEATVASGATHEEVIEKIDIGGISLIRAAAKNYRDVVVVPSKGQYGELLEELQTGDCSTTMEFRRAMAAKAFAVTRDYDAAIGDYLGGGSMALRYGENPHQRGRFIGDLSGVFTQLHGKEISYNNILDIDSALALMSDFDASIPTVAILKHNNPCGLACRATLLEAWQDALAGDPVSAFGGIIVSNTAVDEGTAEAMGKIFFEVIIAPEYSDGALEILCKKKNRIILRSAVSGQQSALREQPYNTVLKRRSALGGYLEQERDSVVATEKDLRIVSGDSSPISEDIVADMLFAEKIVKHCKSNAIVLTRSGQLLAAGVGQTSRVDALKQAIAKAQSFGFDLKGATMASDAFFPFPDCVEIAYNVGIRSVIQPGGSIRDNESIEFCKQHNMTMAITGIRHFRH